MGFVAEKPRKGYGLLGMGELWVMYLKLLQTKLVYSKFYGV